MKKPKRLVTSLEHATNAYGRTIYVEEWEEKSGRPRVWYEINRQDRVVKYVRGTTCITATVRGKWRYV